MNQQNQIMNFRADRVSNKILSFCVQKQCLEICQWPEICRIYLQICKLMYKKSNAEKTKKVKIYLAFFQM